MVTDPLANSDELADAVVDSGAVVGSVEEPDAVDNVLAEEDDSSVHVSGTEVVAYVRLDSYEPVLLGLLGPVPAVPLDTGAVPWVDHVLHCVEDGEPAAVFEGLVLLSAEVVDCALELVLSGAVELAPEELFSSDE